MTTKQQIINQHIDKKYSMFLSTRWIMNFNTSNLLDVKNDQRFQKIHHALKGFYKIENIVCIDYTNKTIH